MSPEIRQENVPVSPEGNQKVTERQVFSILPPNEQAVQLYDKAERLTKEIEGQKVTFSLLETVTLLGFVIALFMLATVLVMVWLDWKNSDERVLDKIEAIQEKLNIQEAQDGLKALNFAH